MAAEEELQNNKRMQWMQQHWKKRLSKRMKLHTRQPLFNCNNYGIFFIIST